MTSFLIYAAMNASCLALTPQNYPNELKYKGQPIDPLCFEGEEKKVSLDKCGLNFHDNLKVTGKDADLIKKDYYGFEYQDNDTPGTTASSYYKLIGQYKDALVLYRISNGGGSGVFTSVDLVKRNGDMISIDTLGVGDRCNNGIDEPTVTNNILSYVAYITPFDYLTIAQQNPHKLQAYDDLASCAACCYGQARFQLNLADKKEKFINIDLPANKEDVDNQTQGKYQHCFNKIMMNYLQQKQTTMDPKELKTFVDRFNTECVK